MALARGRAGARTDAMPTDRTMNALAARQAAVTDSIESFTLAQLKQKLSAVFGAF